jgi:SAM-dependent methyltransferase
MVRTLFAMDEPVVATEIFDHYQQDYDESRRITAGIGTLELVRTQEIIGRVLPPGPLNIVDVGGGTGVHARWLAAAGHRVEVVDPMPRHVTAASALADEGLAVTARLGDARALPYDDRTADVVLLLGPLYHLIERADRVQAWQEAIRVVKPGGPVIAAAVNRFASLFSGLTFGLLVDDRFRAIVEQDLHDGQHRNPDRTPHWFTTAYFHRPADLAAEATEGGAAVTEVLGVEGLAAWLPQLEGQWDDEHGRAAILDAARAIESEPTLLGLSAHLLVIANRPA